MSARFAAPGNAASPSDYFGFDCYALIFGKCSIRNNTSPIASRARATMFSILSTMNFGRCFNRYAAPSSPHIAVSISAPSLLNEIRARIQKINAPANP